MALNLDGLKQDIQEAFEETFPEAFSQAISETFPSNSTAGDEIAT
jgi:hypothetical protein